MFPLDLVQPTSPLISSRKTSLVTEVRASIRPPTTSAPTRRSRWLPRRVFASPGLTRDAPTTRSPWRSTSSTSEGRDPSADSACPAQPLSRPSTTCQPPWGCRHWGSLTPETSLLPVTSSTCLLPPLMTQVLTWPVSSARSLYCRTTRVSPAPGPTAVSSSSSTTPCPNDLATVPDRRTETASPPRRWDLRRATSVPWSTRRDTPEAVSSPGTEDRPSPWRVATAGCPTSTPR